MTNFTCKESISIIASMTSSPLTVNHFGTNKSQKFSISGGRYLIRVLSFRLMRGLSLSLSLSLSAISLMGYPLDIAKELAIRSV